MKLRLRRGNGGWAWVALGCLALGVAARAVAQPVGGGFAAGAAKTAVRLTPQERDERAFLRSAAAAVRFGWDASQLAATRATDPRVRAFAADMVAQQRRASDELQQLLQARRMALPMLDNGQRTVLNRLARLSGRRFERNYLEQVGLKLQVADLRQHEQALGQVADPALRDWVERQLPTLRLRAQAAEDLMGRPAGAVSAVSASNTR